MKLKNKVIPPHLIVREGATAEFNCISNVNVTWTYEGGVLPFNAEHTYSIDSVLHWIRIILVKIENAGVYTCHGEDDDYLFEADGHLTVTNG